jgi:cyclophilin family peptidyl-prolyl cis-trans isomerase
MLALSKPQTYVLSAGNRTAFLILFQVSFFAELPPLELEYKLHNVKYAVSMGRTDDPNSGSSEFAIMLANNTIVNGIRPPSYVISSQYEVEVLLKLISAIYV